MSADELNNIIKENYPFEPIYEKFDLDRWGIFFKKIVDNEFDPINQKYRDIVNCVDRYDASYGKLKVLNN